MDSNDRIADLERRVEELTTIIRELRAQETQPPASRHEPSPRKKPTPPSQDDGAAKQVFKNDFRRNVDKVLGGEEGDSIETRIGGIWMSRLAVVLLMTAVVLGARVTLYADVFGPLQKIGILYAGSIAAVLYGVYFWKSRDFFSQTLLGAGMAGVYFATYAAFFVEGLRIVSPSVVTSPLLLASLVAIIVVCHLRRSQAVAGISLFLVYYTVVASCTSGGATANVVYALLTCTVLAAAAVIFQALHRWLFFTWGALVASHLTYFYFFRVKPPELNISQVEYFWISNGFLTVSYIAFSLACIVDAWKTGEYRKTVAPMSGFNSAIYFSLMWMAVRHHYLAHEWLFRLGLAVMLLAFAFMAETSGPRRNYLFQIFIAKAVVMFTLALQAYMSGERLLVAMSVECLGLAFSYKRSGTVIFKVLGLCMMLITFVGCIARVKAFGTIELGPYTVPSNWFCCVGSSFFFVITSWFYEKFVRRVRPEDRTVSGQWFMADTFLDARTATAALLHAAAAALIMLTITIIDRGNDPRLPYILAAEGAIMTLTGFILRTPQVEVGGVLLLVAAHICYHAFLLLGIPGFEQQAGYAVYTALVALLTFLGAYFWERYLRRVKGGRDWEHHVVASIPYLAATFMFTTLFDRSLNHMYIPLAQAGLGVLLLMAGCLTQYPGVKASGLLAFGIATASCYTGLYNYNDSFAEQPWFLGHFSLFLLSYALGERLFVILERQQRASSPTEDAIRTILVCVAAGLGAIGLHLFADPSYLTLYWLGLAVVTFVLGAVFRESRYRWIARVLFMACAVRAYAYDLRALPPLYSFLSFTALAVVLLVIAWAYSRRRPQKADTSPSPPPDVPADAPPHE